MYTRKLALAAMLSFLSTVGCGVILASVGYAAALPSLQTRAVTQVSSADLSALAPFTHFAGAAYCGIAQLNAWSCSRCLDQAASIRTVSDMIMCYSSMQNHLRLHAHACRRRWERHPAM